MVEIGYARQLIGTCDTVRSCTLKTASEGRFKAWIVHNLDALECMLRYTASQGIGLFLISSESVPLASSSGAYDFNWRSQFSDRFKDLGALIQENGIRVSMHPGSETLLNAPDPDVAERALLDLEYHCDVLDLMALDATHKIVLNIGGVYGDKQAAAQRFKSVYRSLSDTIRNRLVLENDSTHYTAHDVYQVCRELGCPMAFDTLSHQMNPSSPFEASTCAPSEQALKANAELEIQVQWLQICKETWRPFDGPQKLRYAQQHPGKKPGTPSETIDAHSFLSFIQALSHRGLYPDIMLESGDKNLSAVKCQNVLIDGAEREKNPIGRLEREWARYKYTILERRPSHYQAIRTLLKDKSAYPVIEFYRLIDEGVSHEPTPGSLENGLLHVWGYFKSKATDAEHRQFFKKIEALTQENRSQSERLKSAKAARTYLHSLATKYHITYLLNSLYFDL